MLRACLSLIFVSVLAELSLPRDLPQVKAQGHASRVLPLLVHGARLGASSEHSCASARSFHQPCVIQVSLLAAVCRMPAVSLPPFSTRTILPTSHPFPTRTILPFRFASFLAMALSPLRRQFVLCRPPPLRS
eukprot:4651802-Pleurochrysis_carterae.AAC.1